MFVVATAGHVDHGKSTLVRALTGMEPDRWAEERRRGMTIDLGYAWTRLGTGEELAFVDVPGHQRFIANMLAGLGPSPAVLMVVAADEGWRAQSSEHLAAVDALGLTHGLLVVTRSDLADPASALREGRARLAGSSLGEAPALAVSGVTGQGLEQLRTALHELVTRLPDARTDGRVRLWVDRSFTIRGSGTVVTGTLGGGTLRVGDELELRSGRVRVRGLQSLGRSRDSVAAVARVAVNLRGLPREAVHRGDALLTPERWRLTAEVDARLTAAVDDLPEQLVLHAGTAAVPARLRPLGDDIVRLTLLHPLPLVAGDRAVLRDPGRHSIGAGVAVLDVDPPPLGRRGAAAARARDLASPAPPSAVAEVSRRGAVRRAELEALGIPLEERDHLVDLRSEGDWLVAPATWRRWCEDLTRAMLEHEASSPLDPRLPMEAARRAAGLPDMSLVGPVAEAAGLDQGSGRVWRPGATPSLGPAEAGMQALEQRLRAAPFEAPERPELQAWGLGPRELAAAERAGRLVRLDADLVLLPSAPALAMRALSALDQPFTTSQARQALGTTRRVAVPLLEHLDARGWTRRLDAGHREVRRA